MPTELAGIAIVPLIIGLVEVAKRLGLDARWAPPLAVALGLGISLGAWAAGGCGLEAGAAPRPSALLPPATCSSPFEALLTGLALGLSASGLYSAARKTLEA